MRLQATRVSCTTTPGERGEHNPKECCEQPDRGHLLRLHETRSHGRLLCYIMQTQHMIPAIIVVVVGKSYNYLPR